MAKASIRIRVVQVREAEAAASHTIRTEETDQGARREATVASHLASISHHNPDKEEKKRY